MPDMLARLYDLPEAAPYERRVADRNLRVRRAEPWDKVRLRDFALKYFSDVWALETERAFISTPVTAYLALENAEIAGFAVYECTRRGFFGPTGVREDLRGSGLGALLLLRCLESMREMGYGYAIIGGVGPAAFYEKIVGATVIQGSDPGVYAPLYEMRGTA
ncbi:MAG: GNAT family N-acetyltransferase [Dehalococcoidia bacterium]